MAYIEVIRHVAFEDLGVLTSLLAQRGDEVTYHEAMDVDFNLAQFQKADLLVVLGAPIGANDEDKYLFLKKEMRCIKRRMLNKKPILGICLGAQLMARVLGAEVTSLPAKEIGFAPLVLTVEGRHSPLKYLSNIPVLHWHGDQFTLAPDAVRLAYTHNCMQQAFSVENYALGLQFHMEVDATRIEHWLVGHACELAEAGCDLAQIREDAGRYGPMLREAAMVCMGEWLKRVLL